MHRPTVIALPLLVVLATIPARLVAADPPAVVDMPGFLALSAEAAEYRARRIVDAERFLQLAATPGVVLLDTRSETAYASKHLVGAVHLPFSDFTKDRLAELIPDPATTILIYCNNNIRNDDDAFPSKRAPLALNIPTFINLYGYGYRDIYELGSLVDIADPRFRFVGTAPRP